MSRGDGDGWVAISDGSRRWGLFGAAGLLLSCRDSAGTGHILLQHRAWWSHLGGTWGVPGGARDSGESALQAALREFGEEVAGTLDGVEPRALHLQDHGVWSYETVLARIPELRAFAPGNAESADIRWVPYEQVAGLALLPAFAAVWAELVAVLDQRLLVVVDARGSGGPVGTPDGGAQRAGTALSALAREGVPGSLLPPGLPLAPLHLWFPRVRLLVDAPDTVAAPGVEAVPVRGLSAADTAMEATAPSPGTPADESVLLLTADTALSAACAARGAVPAPASWLDTALTAADH